MIGVKKERGEADFNAANPWSTFYLFGWSYAFCEGRLPFSPRQLPERCASADRADRATGNERGWPTPRLPHSPTAKSAIVWDPAKA